ncbi:hypothetical protein F8M41_016137 [Gigaspora margarita]|uniref:Uncharacterized protein n=1 Tax=Gigaspora margarita TaxID=4874 RepID=A0A8H4APR8_GIGMA|nr:hypothetical protein F8M41_016137 [Gigaspora margarita]
MGRTNRRSHLKRSFHRSGRTTNINNNDNNNNENDNNNDNNNVERELAEQEVLGLLREISLVLDWEGSYNLMRKKEEVDYDGENNEMAEDVREEEDKTEENNEEIDVEEERR